MHLTNIQVYLNNFDSMNAIQLNFQLNNPILQDWVIQKLFSNNLKWNLKWEQDN